MIHGPTVASPWQREVKVTREYRNGDKNLEKYFSAGNSCLKDNLNVTKPSPSPNLSQAPLNPLLYLEHINTLTLIPGPPSPVVVRILLSQVRENPPSWISIKPACRQQESFYPSCLLLVFNPLTPHSMRAMIPPICFSCIEPESSSQLQ